MHLNKILLVAADKNLPGPSYSGNSLIRWGLISGLVNSGKRVGFYNAKPHVSQIRKYNGNELKTILNHEDIWIDMPGIDDKNACLLALSQSIAQFQPDLILAYGPLATKLVRKSGYKGLLGIMSVDIEFLPQLYRTLLGLKLGSLKSRLTTLVSIPFLLFKIFLKYNFIIHTYCKADFIINHAANHAGWYRKKFGLPTLYTPNPVPHLPKSSPKRTMGTRPKFLLLGNLNGIATLTGLEWFARKVYPLIEKDLASNKYQILLAGRHRIKYPQLHNLKHIVYRGYIEDLDSEMSQVTAILVPTPIELGFRTRIVEAFRHSVPVIAHSANAAGIRGLENFNNCLLASNPLEFAKTIRILAENQKLALKIGSQGYEWFKNNLNADICANHILQFIEGLGNHNRT